MRRLFAVVVTCVAFASSGHAADRPIRPMVVKAPLPAPPPVSPWAGWYAGLNIGYGWGDPGATVDPATAPPPPTSTNISSYIAAPPFTLANHPRGATYGFQIGRNWQIGSLVYGVEADFNASTMNDQAGGGFVNAITFDTGPGSTSADVTLQSRIDWFSTVRGRFGYAFDRVMGYATGGLAIARTRSMLAISGMHIEDGLLIGKFGDAATFSETQFGTALGGGVEIAFSDRWLMRGEYLYLNFKGSTYATPIIAVSALDTGFYAHLARFALNYRFVP